MHLIEQAVNLANLNMAMNRVIQYKENPGTDGVTVVQLEGDVRECAMPLLKKIRNGSDQP